MYRKSIQTYLLLALLSISFHSCELEPEQTGNIIEPQILNSSGLPAQNGIGVSVGSVPITIPDLNGYCRIENVSLPYDLQIHAPYDEQFIYYKLNVRYPRIVLPISIYSSLHNTCSVPVKCPGGSPFKAAFVRFISKEIFGESETVKLIEFPDSTTLINVWLAPDKVSISGKLIFLYGNFDPYYQYMSSFDKHCVKDISLRAGMNDTVKFTEAEIQFNPPESYVRCSAVYPEFISSHYTDVSISFPGYNPNSEMLLVRYSNPSGEPRDAHVPGEMETPFEIKVASSYTFYELIAMEIEVMESFHVQPGASIEIIHTELEMLGPQNQQYGITKDSCLTVSEDKERGIYFFLITELGTSSTIAFVTEKNSVRCGDLKYRNFEIRPGKTYKWIVCKYSNFNSINDFTASPYIFQENFHSVRASEVRHFSTAP